MTKKKKKMKKTYTWCSMYAVNKHHCLNVGKNFQDEQGHGKIL